MLSREDKKQYRAMSRAELLVHKSAMERSIIAHTNVINGLESAWLEMTNDAHIDSIKRSTEHLQYIVRCLEKK